MSAPIDDDFLNKTYYAWNTQGFFSDILDFLQFSEANIEWQWRRELQILERRAKEKQLEEEYVAHLRENINGRFGASLSQRLRYAVLSAIVTTAEWTAVLYGRYAKPPIPQKSNPEISPAVHIFSVFNDRANLGLNAHIATLQKLVYVRNCVTHNAGLLEGYKYQDALPDVIKSLCGFSLPDNPWVGAGIEIARGVLDQHIQEMMDWMPKLVEECTKKGFIQH